MDNEKYDGQTVPLAYHEMCQTRSDRRLLWVVIGWVITVAIFSYMWLQYDYVSTTDTTGVYVLMDSEGNVIANDLGPDDVIHIMEDIASGKRSQETDSN